MTSDAPAGQFDFDEWVRLARDDPEAFERQRREALESAIGAAPDGIRRRLEGLQWQVEQVRERSGSPMGACIKLSSLMWKRVAGEDGLLDSLDALARASQGEVVERPRADVLPFEQRAGRARED